MVVNEYEAVRVCASAPTCTLHELRGDMLFSESLTDSEPFKNSSNILVLGEDRAYGLAALIRRIPPWMGFNYIRRSLVPLDP